MPHSTYGTEFCQSKLCAHQTQRTADTGSLRRVIPHRFIIALTSGSIFCGGSVVEIVSSQPKDGSCVRVGLILRH